MGSSFSSNSDFVPTIFQRTLQSEYDVQRVRRGRRAPLGAGSQGEVWPCTHKKSRQLCVVKSVPRGAEGGAQQMVQNEIRILQAIAGRSKGHPAPTPGGAKAGGEQDTKDHTLEWYIK